MRFLLVGILSIIVLPSTAIALPPCAAELNQTPRAAAVPNLEIKESNKVILWWDQPVVLSGWERDDLYRLLKLFAERKNILLSHLEIYKGIYPGQPAGAMTVTEARDHIDNLVGQLRRAFLKIDSQFDSIQSVGTQGHYWRVQSTPPAQLAKLGEAEVTDSEVIWKGGLVREIKIYDQEKRKLLVFMLEHPDEPIKFQAIALKVWPEKFARNPRQTLTNIRLLVGILSKDFLLEDSSFNHLQMTSRQEVIWIHQGVQSSNQVVLRVRKRVDGTAYYYGDASLRLSEHKLRLLEALLAVAPGCVSKKDLLISMTKGETARSLDWVEIQVHQLREILAELAPDIDHIPHTAKRGYAFVGRVVVEDKIR